jgi:bifunctional non-homologous end joining protein LigD
VAEISFASWTKSSLLRQASFKGLREDKKAEEVVKELASDHPDSGSDAKDRALPLTSPGKEMYPGVSKKDVMDYYRKIAPRLLPFVKGRLASLVRCPSGTDEQCFYQKHLQEKVPGLGETELREADGDLAGYLAVEDEDGILNAVQLNTIEFHVWGSRLETLEKPDTVVFDLDPDDGLDLQAVRRGIRDLKGILDEIGLTSYLKTSGSKGYHVVIPLNPAAQWDTVRDFARRVAEAMEEKWPDRYTSNVRKVKRKGRIFIDWIRNTRGATSVAPYSLRARDVPAVSCPISWDEMDRVAPQDITMHNIFRRRKNPWAEYFNSRQELK